MSLHRVSPLLIQLSLDGRFRSLVKLGIIRSIPRVTSEYGCLMSRFARTSFRFSRIVGNQDLLGVLPGTAVVPLVGGLALLFCLEGTSPCCPSGEVVSACVAAASAASLRRLPCRAIGRPCVLLGFFDRLRLTLRHAPHTLVPVGTVPPVVTP